MAGWVGQSQKLFDPLVAALERYTLAGEKVHADDTPVAVLDPGRGRTKTGRLWVYVRDDRPAGNIQPPAAWYRCSPNRKGERPQAHLANYSGILQADAYGGYGKIYASGRVVSILLGSRAQTLLGSAREPGLRAGLDCRAGAAAHCGAVHHRSPDPGSTSRRETPGEASPRRAAVG